MTQQVMFKAIDSSQTLMLDDTVVSLCMYEGLTSMTCVSFSKTAPTLTALALVCKLKDGPEDMN